MLEVTSFKSLQQTRSLLLYVFVIFLSLSIRMIRYLEITLSCYSPHRFQYITILSTHLLPYNFTS